jgi:hypothetical protein
VLLCKVCFEAGSVTSAQNFIKPKKLSILLTSPIQITLLYLLHIAGSQVSIVDVAEKESRTSIIVF